MEENFLFGFWKGCRLDRRSNPSGTLPGGFPLDEVREFNRGNPVTSLISSAGFLIFQGAEALPLVLFAYYDNIRRMSCGRCTPCRAGSIDGSVLSVEASFSLNIKNDEGKMIFCGTKAGAALNPELELYGELDGYMTDISLKAETTMNFSDIFRQEIFHFVDCIENGTECLSPAEDGVEMMRILNAIYESARCGHEVLLK